MDVVLYFEGDRQQEYRLLRAVKNRFGSVNELGVFEMTQEGMRVVENPSEQLLFPAAAKGASGSVVFCGMEGLTAAAGGRAGAGAHHTCSGPPGAPWPAARTRGGVALLLAVLEKRAGLPTLQPGCVRERGRAA